MQKTILSACMLAGIAAQGQDFKLSGNVGSATYSSNNYIYLSYVQDDQTFTDSCLLKGGEYHFNGALRYPAEARLYLRVTDSVMQYYNTTRLLKPFEYVFFLDKGTLTAASKGELRQTTLQGSAAEDDRQAIQQQLAAIREQGEREYGRERENVYRANDTAGIARVSRKMSANDREQQAARLRFLQTHPQTGIALALLAEYTRTKIDLTEIDPVYSNMLPALRSSPEGTAYGIRLKKARQTAPGMPAPEITLKDRNGKTVSLSGLKGKVVLLDFWGSWCYPCRMSHPHLRELYDRYRSKGFEILGVSNERGEPATWHDKWTKALDTDKMTWLNVLNTAASTDKEKGILNDYDVKAYPTKFVIDRNGKIVVKLVGNSPASHDELEAQLSRLLAPQ